MQNIELTRDNFYCKEKKSVLKSFNTDLYLFLKVYT